MAQTKKKDARQAEICDLCGEIISGEPVVRKYDGDEKHFCCEGCTRVYDNAHRNDVLDMLAVDDKPTHKRISQLVLDPGESAQLSVKGMWCPGCAEAAERVISKQSGVRNVQINFGSEQGIVNYDPERTNLDSILGTLNRLGYQARLLNESQDKDSEKQQERMLLQLIVSAAFGMQVMLIYLVQLYPRYAAGEYNNPEVRNLEYMVWALATPVLLFGGLSFITGAWRALQAQTANMDTLVALGTLTAYTYSAYISLTGGGEVYFDSVVMITTFIMLGRYLETLGGGRARKEIRKLLQLQPKNALKKDNESWQEVSAYDLNPGDIILIKPGSRIPADAKILEGNAAVDESLLTGESAPVEKKEGDKVFAGTIVTDSSLICRVHVSVKETRLAQITKLVEKTLSTKPPIQRLADKASAYFTFIILGIACLTMVGWYVIGQDTSEALLASVAVLVVACPCALGLATPLALTITLGRSAKVGILVRKNASLEEAAKIDRIVLDKTGTLTQGKMSVSASYADEKYVSDTSELVCMAASVEQFSEHPIARAIVTACDESLREARDFQSHRGSGASALVGDGTARRVLVGSESYLKIREGSKFPDEVSIHFDQGETVVWVGWDGIVAGFIALSDKPRSSASSMLQELKEEGFDVVMLSGDNPRTTEVVARELGISHYEGNCPPEEKAARISEWQDSGERIAMVGDGVNDAPALAQADISITASGGTDVAGEISDVILIHPDLDLIPWFFRLSKNTRRIIIQNLGWAFLYNVVTLPLAALGIISPVIAAIAMASSSLLVVGNSLRLRN